MYTLHILWLHTEGQDRPQGRAFHSFCTILQPLSCPLHHGGQILREQGHHPIGTELSRRRGISQDPAHIFQINKTHLLPFLPIQKVWKLEKFIFNIMFSNFRLFNPIQSRGNTRSTSSFVSCSRSGECMKLSLSLWLLARAACCRAWIVFKNINIKLYNIF